MLSDFSFCLAGHSIICLLARNVFSENSHNIIVCRADIMNDVTAPLGNEFFIEKIILL